VPYELVEQVGLDGKRRDTQGAVAIHVETT
jgi:hypothetical protein